MLSRRVLGELVFSENISVGEIAEESICKDAGTDFCDIESDSSADEITPEASSTITGFDDESYSTSRNLFHAAMFLNDKIKGCKPFYDNWPPSPSDISISVMASWFYYRCII
ncbi:Hypothetical predicted protein [Paramuricea clavata]|uniref:Uncharacterized protein n=1 Tax=Paramuricea clavata TaxID=317549 RepID=A0A7D9ERA8_PARCT|nr:Hypothetical predicted protein [Paramuricea clavata]